VPGQVTEEMSKLLSERANAVLDQWQAAAVNRSSTSDAASLKKELADLYKAFVSGVSQSGGTRGEGFAEMRALLATMSVERARRGNTPTETASAMFALRGALHAALGDEHAAELAPLSSVIEDLGLFTFESFTAARESVIFNQTEQLLELSTPVVKLWDGVLALPLVGTLDSARTQVVMETLLQTLVDTGSAHAIIDITGVAAVDTQVAQHLLKTVVAARLMGAECIISGIRPQIAQTVVALGIEFGDIPTKATLADALRQVLRQSGYDIVRRADRAD
jgi:rsbT co-antagonist protein RsbR